MWETIQSAIIGLLAPAGIWLGWFLQRRDKVTEQGRERRQLLRQKAEEIYDEIEAIRERNSRAVMAAVDYAYSDGVEIAELMPSLGRLKALVHMYFQDGAALFEPYDNAVYEPIQKLGSRIDELKSDQSLKGDVRVKKMKEARLECVQGAAMVLVDLLGNLAQFMHGESRKLI